MERKYFLNYSTFAISKLIQESYEESRGDIEKRRA